MENTRRVGHFPKVRSMAGRIMVCILLSYLIGRGTFLEGCFPAAVAFTAFMVSRNTINIYLIIPVGAGMVPMIMTGFDGMGDLIAMILCGLLFVTIRKVKLQQWQKTLLTGSTYVISESVYRIMSHTVYKMNVEDLLLQTLIVMGFTYIFYVFFQTVLSRQSVAASELSGGSLTAICLLVVWGAGLDFLIWPLIIFLGLWALAYGGTGEGAAVVLMGTVYAALVGQGQWGMGITILTGLLGAAFIKVYGKAPGVCVFVLLCFFLGKVESGVILGVDNLCLFPAAALFIVATWRFDKGFKYAAGLFFGKTKEDGGEDRAGQLLLETRAGEMARLAGIYSTYLDSRSLLANQFGIMEQILLDIRQEMRNIRGRSRRGETFRFSLEVAASQCAAMGTINGDSCGWQDIGGGHTAMIISDGMGRGKKAATESLMVTKTIISLLKSGVSVDMTLKMINTVMLIKENEDSFATVDLVVVNRGNGKAKFYKIGAAPTLLRRKNNIEEVKLNAVPLGIVNGIKVDYVEASLRQGDWIIMMSDGISDGGDRRGFLEDIKDTAVNIRSEDTQTMCDLILNRASDSYIGKERDDLTVLVARID